MYRHVKLVLLHAVIFHVGDVRVTFCKSGKDRTGMAVTLEQSRALSEFFGFDFEEPRLLRDANTMRRYGTRLAVAEKNVSILASRRGICRSRPSPILLLDRTAGILHQQASSSIPAYLVSTTT